MVYEGQRVGSNNALNIKNGETHYESKHWYFNKKGNVTQ